MFHIVVFFKGVRQQLHLMWLPPSTWSDGRGLMVKKAPEGTQAVIRAIRLLKELARRDAEISVGELCGSVDLTRTTAHRLLAALVSEGLVVRNPVTGGYRVGPGVIALGARALLGNDLRELVRPELEKLASETGESGTLEILADGRMLILSEVAGRFLVTATAEVGTSWPIHATSTGKAILARMDRDERRRILKTPLSRHTDRTITSIRRLDEELDRVRKNGYATAVEELEIGAVAVAAALFETSSGQAVGAISVGGPTSRLGRRDLVTLGERLASTAERLSGQMG